MLTDKQNIAPCPICGAVQAPKGERGVCGHCWSHANSEIPYQLKSKLTVSDERFTEIVADEIKRTQKRIMRYGFSERCEHLSKQGNGHQCGSWATKRRNGRSVCAIHDKHFDGAFVGTTNPREYMEIENSNYMRVRNILLFLVEQNLEARHALIDVSRNISPSTEEAPAP